MLTDIPGGRKLALKAMQAGDMVVKYERDVARATRDHVVSA